MYLVRTKYVFVLSTYLGTYVLTANTSHGFKNGWRKQVLRALKYLRVFYFFLIYFFLI